MAISSTCCPSSLIPCSMLGTKEEEDANTKKVEEDAKEDEEEAYRPMKSRHRDEEEKEDK